jgi:alpha-mannosidase
MHSQIPQLLAGFGFTGAILRTHFMMYGYNPTFRVPVGWWLGLDGSRIPSVPTYEGEGAEFGQTTTDNWILTRYPGPECSTPLEKWQEQFPGIRPLLASRADDSGLRREELVKQYEGKPGYRWILLEDWSVTAWPTGTIRAEGTSLMSARDFALSRAIAPRTGSIPRLG